MDSFVYLWSILDEGFKLWKMNEKIFLQIRNK